MKTVYETKLIAGWNVHAWCSDGRYWYGLCYRPGDRTFEVSIKGIFNSKEAVFARAEEKLPGLTDNDTAF